MSDPLATASLGWPHRLRRYWFAGFNLAYWFVTLVAFTAFLKTLRPEIVPPDWFVAARLISGFLFCSWLHSSVGLRPGLRGWRRFFVVLGFCAVFVIVFSLALQWVCGVLIQSHGHLSGMDSRSILYRCPCVC